MEHLARRPLQHDVPITNLTTHLPPLMEHPARSSLQHDVPAVPGRLTTTVEQPRLPEAGQVEFHPRRPVATVTTVHKLRTLQVEGSTAHDRCFLE